MGGGDVNSADSRDSDVGSRAPAGSEFVTTEPKGELVTVITEANPNYRLTVKRDVPMLTFKDSRDIHQQWIKIDVGKGNGGFIDREGQPGFILVNNATGQPLKHGQKVDDIVTIRGQVYGVDSREGSIIWSLGKKDQGRGYRGLRAVTNISLNLVAQNADKEHGGVQDGNLVMLSNWKPIESLKWKLEPLESAGQDKNVQVA